MADIFDLSLLYNSTLIDRKEALFYTRSEKMDHCRYMNDRSGKASTKYKSITVSHGEHHFTVYCTALSMNTRRDEVMTWIDRLCSRLRWHNPERVIENAMPMMAEKVPEALFDNRLHEKVD